MSVENAKKTLDVAGHGLQALEVIGTLVGKHAKTIPSGAASDLWDAMDVLGKIGVLVNTVRASLNGTVSVEDLEKQITKLRADLAQNDTAIDAAIDAKPER